MAGRIFSKSMHQANGVPPFVTGIKYKEGGYYAVRSLDVVWTYVSDATNRSVPAYLNCNAKLESESKAKAQLNDKLKQVETALTPYEANTTVAITTSCIKEREQLAE